MLHDIAKEMPHDEAVVIMQKNYPDYLNKPEAVWHQWLSEYVAKNEYLVDDPEILQAMTASVQLLLYICQNFDMCIYEADKYDPSRDYRFFKKNCIYAKKM